MSRPAQHQAPDFSPEQRAAQHLAVVARRFAAGRASAVELDEAVHLWQRLRGRGAVHDTFIRFEEAPR